MSKLRRSAAAVVAAWIGVLSVSSATVAAAVLKREALSGWNNYAGQTERRITRELATPGKFLAQDFRADAAALRRSVLAGTIVVTPVATDDSRGNAIDVPSALVHHWRGAVFIPGARLDTVLAQLQNGTPGAKQEDVLQSKILERNGNQMKVFLKVQRKKFVTVVYNTEHLVKIQRHSATRASSSSTATKIAEVSSPGTAQERELTPGNDRGFLWRWNSYWRYEEVPGGVIAECESVSLSRSVPSVLWYVAAPLIRSTARESMERTLATFRERFRRT